MVAALSLDYVALPIRTALLEYRPWFGLDGPEAFAEIMVTRISVHDQCQGLVGFGSRFVNDDPSGVSEVGEVTGTMLKAVFTLVSLQVSRSSWTCTSFASTRSTASAPRTNRNGGCAARVAAMIALAASAGSPACFPSRASALAGVLPLVAA